MFGLLEEFLRIVGNTVSSLGYIGVAVGMMLESACIPIPSELILPLAGFMSADGKINMIGANIAVCIGSMLGSYMAYFAGYHGGRKLILKYGRFLFVSEHHFLKAEAVFRRYGSAAVFFGRLLPVIRTFISLPAGISKMDLKKFMLFSLSGMLPWNFLLIYLGYRFGQNYDTIVRPFLKKYEYTVIILILVITAYIFIKKLSRKRAQNPPCA